MRSHKSLVSSLLSTEGMTIEDNSNSDNVSSNNASGPPTCLSGVLAKIAVKEKKFTSSSSAPMFKPKLMHSLFLSGVDMEEVAAALTQEEKLVPEEPSSTGVSPIRDAARGKIHLSTKLAKERKPILRSAATNIMTPGEKADAMKKLDPQNMSNLVSMLRPAKHQEEKIAPVDPKGIIREQMFDKHGEPLNQFSVAASLHEVQSKVLPKIILTGNNVHAKIEEKRGSDYFVDEQSVASTMTSSTVDARNYYGVEARQKLFQHYRKMSRQKFNYTGTECYEPVDSVNELSSIYCSSPTKQSTSMTTLPPVNNETPRAKDTAAVGSKTLRKAGNSSLSHSMSASSTTFATSSYAGLRLKNERRTPQHPYESTFLPKFDVFAGVDEELIKHSRSNYFSYKCLAQKVYDDDKDDDEDSEGTAEGDAEEKSGNGSNANSPGGSQKDSLKDSEASKPGIGGLKPGSGLEASLSLISAGLSLAEEAVIMNSPRTKYIGGCIREQLQPLPRLVCRADRNCRKIDVSSYGVGDAMGRVFAECMYDLPNVEMVDISDNALTDHSLPYILDALGHMPHLTELNLSRNKIDDKASEALARYVANPDTPVVKLIMQNADVDDFECAAFVETLKTNMHLRDLDLSNNLLGSAEILNSVFDEITTGGEALAEYLAEDGCRLQALHLAWNSIRLGSAMKFVQAIAVNSTLTFLDLSYNGLGSDAGEMMGDALQQNRVLRTLLLANNNFGSVAAFSLAVGVIDNLCIRRLSMDENPIGEGGARAVMQVPITIGSRVNLTATNCNTAVRDDKCWFNHNSPGGSYDLNLEIPFQRAICISLLQIIAIHRTYIFSRVSLDRGNKSQKLKLVQGMARDIEQFFDDHQKNVIKGLRLLQDAAQNTELGTRLFREADTDGSGELDKDELRKVLNRMGFDKMDHDKMEDLMAVFDIDGAGTIVEDEFLSLLRSQAREAGARIDEMTSYPIMALASSPDKKYVPPRKGIMRMQVIDGFVRKDNHKVISATDQKYALSMANNMGSVAHMDSAIKNTKVRLSEAAEIYKMLYLETGDMAATLAKLLPQMVFASEARHLMSKITKDDRVKISQVKRKVGVALKPILGMVNGYYILDLKKELDRLCLSLLLEQSESVNSKMFMREEPLFEGGVVGDTSQRGHWSCFRNERFNGEPYEVTIGKFTPMKTSGILEFDFSGGTRPDGSEMAISDRRLVKVLRNLALLNKQEVSVAEAKLKEWKKAAKKGEQGVGWSIYEVPLAKAREIGLAKEEFYDSLDERMEAVKEAVRKEIIKVKIKHKHADKRRGSMGSVVSINTSLGGNPREPEEDIRSEADEDELNDVEEDDAFGELPTIRNNSADELDSGRDVRKPSIINFGGKGEFSLPGDNQAALDALNAGSEDGSVGGVSVGDGSRGSADVPLLSTVNAEGSLEAEDDEVEEQQNARARIVDLKKRMFALIRFKGDVSDNAKAVRISEVLEETFSKVWLRSRHLALIVEYFVYGTTEKADRFGSYLVDLICVLFSRVIDLHNFELVLMLLSAKDHAAVICRLGWLNIFNPMKPDGSYELNIARHEERIITKIIVQLSIDEPGENLTYKQFQWNRESDPIPGWEVTEGWTRHEDLPWRGLFQFTYYSGDNVGKRGCAPIVQLRRALTHMVLLQEHEVYDEDTLPPMPRPNSLEKHAKRKRDRWDDYLNARGLPGNPLA